MPERKTTQVFRPGLNSPEFEFTETLATEETASQVKQALDNLPKKTRTETYSFTGAAAISMTTTLNRDFPNAVEFEVEQFEVTWSTAPTTSQSITVTLQSSRGAAFNTLPISIDPSLASLTSYVKIWEKPYKLLRGDELVVAYTNTDLRTVSGMLKVRPVK